MRMAGSVNKARVLITGSPGVGKTTAIKKVCQLLKDDYHVSLAGFYTEEIRSGRSRDGFDVVTFGGERGPLARKSDLIPMARRKKLPAVGQYLVDLQSFESLALKNLENEEVSLLVIDEIGKMELFSQGFLQKIRHIFNETDLPVIATIPLPTKKVAHVVDEIRSRSDVILIEVTRENREGVVDMILKHYLAAT